MAQAGTTSPSKTLPLVALGLVLMAAEWIVLVAGTKRDEMIVGAAAVLASGAFLLLVHRSSTLRLRFRARDVIACWPVPWYLLQRNAQIIAILFRDIFGIRRAGSHFRACHFVTAKRDPLLAGRRVLATTYTTIAPNFIVIGIDYRTQRMLFHQIERGSVSAMTRSLEGRP